jgi:hypothetical protein
MTFFGDDRLMGCTDGANCRKSFQVLIDFSSASDSLME